MADPTSITGLQDWWTTGTPASPTRVYSDAGSTLVNSDGQAVAEWQGVNGGVIQQTTSGRRPIWDALLGAIDVEYGYDQNLDVASFNPVSSQAFTEFFILELATLRDASGAGGLNTSHQIAIHQNTNNLNFYFQRGGKISVYDAGGPLVDTSPKLHSSRILLVITGGSASAEVLVSGLNINLSAFNANTLTLDQLFGYDGGPESLGARVYDFGYYNRALSGTDLTNLLIWAQTSRGVQSGYLSNTVFDGDSLSCYGMNPSGANRSYHDQLQVPAAHRRVCIAEPSLAQATMLSEATTLCDPWFLAAMPNTCVLWGGTNDLAINSASVATVINNTIAYGSGRQGTGFNTGMMTMLPRPNVNTFTDTNLASYNSQMRSNYDGGTLNANFLVELDQDPTIGGPDGGGTGNNYNATYYQSSDHIHLTALGEAIVANLLYPFWAPIAGVASASYSVAGPTTGTTGTPTTNFTASLVGGCTFNGTQSIKVTCPGGVTCTATAAGGTISGNGTGTVTVTPAAGQTGFTFTLNSTGAGSPSISFTGYSAGGSSAPINRGWTNPSALAVTFSSSGGGGGGPSQSVGGGLKEGYATRIQIKGPFLIGGNR